MQGNLKNIEEIFLSIIWLHIMILFMMVGMWEKPKNNGTATSISTSSKYPPNISYALQIF
jgi:hypothetical protein